MKCFLFVCVTLFVSAPSLAACPTDHEVQQFLNAYAKRQSSNVFERDISSEDARCAREKLAAKLPLYLGQHIGYTLGALSAASADTTAGPVLHWGHMFDRNMVDIIAVLPAQFGAQPRVKMGLLFELKDAHLADAGSPIEALKHIESVVPFIELADAMVAGDVSANERLAMNMGFRGGVLGAEIPLQADQSTADGLGQMRLQLQDLKTGRLLASVDADLNGHPLSVAIQFAQSLQKEGVLLKKGDLLNLGYYLEGFAAESGQHIELKYVGLAGEPTVTVEFN